MIPTSVFRRTNDRRCGFESGPFHLGHGEGCCGIVVATSAPRQSRASAHHNSADSNTRRPAYELPDAKTRHAT